MKCLMPPGMSITSQCCIKSNLLQRGAILPHLKRSLPAAVRALLEQMPHAIVAQFEEPLLHTLSNFHASMGSMRGSGKQPLRAFRLEDSDIREWKIMKVKRYYVICWQA